MRIFLKKFFKPRLSIQVIILMMIVAVASVAFGYQFASMQLQTYYYKIYEKKALSELEVYHDSTKALIKNYFDYSTSLLENIASNKDFYQDLIHKDLNNIHKYLESQRNNHVDTLWVLDGQGTMVDIVSDLPDILQFIGKNYSQRDYFQKAFQSKQTYISNTTTVDSGRNAVIVTAPILNEKNEPVFVVSASNVITKIPEKIRLPKTFDYLYSVLTDTSGNIILAEDNNVKDIINLRDKDRIIRSLVLGQQDVLDEEINYRGELVSGKGSIVDLGENNKLLLVSFYPKSQLQRELIQVQNEVNRIFLGVSLVGSSLLAFSFIIIIWLIKRHDKTCHQNS